MSEPTTNLYNDDFELDTWEAIEDLVYDSCHKDVLSFDEYEYKYGLDLRTYIPYDGVYNLYNDDGGNFNFNVGTLLELIRGIEKCIEELNKTKFEEGDEM